MNKQIVKKTAIYSILVLAGLFLGWLIFSSGDNGQDEHDHEQVEMADEAITEYTCSMHPQVRQDEPGDCPICGMDLIPVTDDEDDHDHEDDPFIMRLPEQQRTWANIRTQVVEVGTKKYSIRLTGKVAVNEKNTRLITATFPGRIEKLFADYTGMYIRQGEKLATIYSPELMQAQQELIQAVQVKDEHPRLYKAARQRLELFNITAGQIEAIEQSEQAIPTMDVYASKSGYLTRRAVSEGDYVSTGQTLFDIADLGSVWIELDAYENHIGLINRGDQAKVNIPAQPKASFSGMVEFVDPFINPQTRTARIRLTVANPDNILKPEMFVNATIESIETEEAYPVVPHTAILWTGKRSVVYVKTSEDNGFTFEFREIETGARLEEGYQVISGLEAGEEIAVSGVFAIDAAAQLRGRYSMMAPPEKTYLPEPFKSNLENLFNFYFDLKNSLAEDSPQQAHKNAHKMKEQLEKVGKHSLEGEHHMFWMEQYEAIEEDLRKFVQAAEIDKKRMHFEHIAEAFISTARTLGAIGQDFYVAFCPMYDDDRGAHWLSEFEEIKNPYFGSMMLRCGEVREKIREGVAQAEVDETREMDKHVH